MTEAVGEAVRNSKFAREFRTDKQGNINVPIGRVSFPPEHLEQNASALYQATVASRKADKRCTSFCYF